MNSRTIVLRIEEIVRSEPLFGGWGLELATIRNMQAAPIHRVTKDIEKFQT